MSNNVYNLKNIPSMPERILSALAYLTFGFVGIILLIISAITKTSLKQFVKFNIFQSVLIGFLFAFVQVTYNVFAAIFNLIGYIPIIGRFINSLFQFIVYYLMGFPLFMGFSLLSLVIILLVLYLTIITLLGKFPYIPLLSNIIKGFLK